MVTCIQTHILSLYISKNEWSESLSEDMPQSQVGTESKGQSQHQQQQRTNKQTNNPNFAKSLIRLSIVSAHDLTLQWPHTKRL